MDEGWDPLVGSVRGGQRGRKRGGRGGVRGWPILQVENPEKRRWLYYRKIGTKQEIPSVDALKRNIVRLIDENGYGGQRQAKI